ncbi:hypothetical protein Salat_0804500 [Sesamum alatum]|uniref:Uncharacterized protein n=1 Tax=Sesamum alatum TaxID=300844 RepID=A0AAE1YVD4_9LAMI|nr:hypothetical protein Salat_0804500 [Sesamum alatum]
MLSKSCHALGPGGSFDDFKPEQSPARSTSSRCGPPWSAPARVTLSWCAAQLEAVAGELPSSRHCLELGGPGAGARGTASSPGQSRRTTPARGRCKAEVERPRGNLRLGGSRQPRAAVPRARVPQARASSRLVPRPSSCSSRQPRAGQFGRPCLEPGGRASSGQLQLEAGAVEPGGSCLELGCLRRGRGSSSRHSSASSPLQHPGLRPSLMSRGQVEAQPWGGCCIRWDLNPGQKDGSK